ncbi:hypothetical protein UCDDA912_g01256 [Diaporthe ampelina]|uniref:Uncharacterized protein n=1 Tax=Diaporthe ampelina TaxID=1214573 RepID=A0A0G2FXG3_9PEZI|nr:hypothetical protein UCDDA912_g01256 [Diaporthe ampelina]
MYIYDMDAHGHTATAEDRRMSFGSLDSDENSFATAAESRTNSGLGVANSGLSNPHPMTCSQLTPATAPSSNWPGGILRRIDIRVESKELLEPRSDAVARPQSRPFPRGVAGDRRRTSEGEDEAWDEVAAFLRNVTPPPSNFIAERRTRSMPIVELNPAFYSDVNNERSRDSSRDQYTLQESIFSEPSFLESYGTVASGSEAELGVVKEAKRAKRFSVVKDKKRSSGHESKRSSGHGSKRSSKQSSKRSSGTIEEEESFEKTRNSTATVLFNPEVKKVDESITRQTQSRKSVEIVVETPTDATFPREESETKHEETVAAQKPPSEGLEQGSEGKGKGKERQQVLQESPRLDEPGQKEEPKGKGTEKAISPVLEAVDNDEQKSKARAQNEGTAQSPLPSPKQRKERRKSTILTRSQRVAELKRALDMPGSEPKDLVWRRLSVSSDGSSSSTEKEAKADPKDILVHVPVVPENNPYSLKTTPGRFSLSAVMTVADVKPCSPLMPSPVLGIEKKNSLPISVSSPGTVATVVMTSPVPPFRTLGSVTPPDSPPQSRSSSSSISSLETQRQATALKHPPLKRLSSESMPRPKTAGKGLLASRKDFYGGRQTPDSPEQDRGEASTSVLKMSRSEIFDRRHPYVPTDRSRANSGVSERSRRLYLLDEHPDLGRRVDDSDYAADQRRTRSHSSHRRSQTADGQKPTRPETLSRTTTMIESSGARTSSMGTVSRSAANPAPGPQRLQDEVEAELERIKRVERLNERIDTHMRGLSLELGRRRRGWSPPQQQSSSSSRAEHGGHGLPGLTRYESRSEASLATYAVPDESGGRAYYSGMHTVEPIMRELQFGGSRLSLESSGSVGFEGDSEVQRLREGPRAVIGFGAFGGRGF